MTVDSTQSLTAVTRPAGPVVQDFILDFENRIQGIMGPYGSGKTTGCMQKVDVIAAVQPICRDGVIRSKGVVIRDNFRTLEKTVLNDWFAIFPKEMRDPITGANMWDFTGGNDRPAMHTRRFKSERGIIESITEFVGIGAQRIENITRGAQWTWGWVNEWDLLHEDVIDAVDGRLPRYPPKRMLLDPNDNPIPFLFGDFNAPDEENWTYRRGVEAATIKLYIQPGGLEPGAENLQNLPRGYYDNIARGKPDWWVRRFVHNRWGASRYGTPVYPEFNDRIHKSEVELMPQRGVPLRIGMDAGGTPAGIIMQELPNGQLRWLDEVVSDRLSITGPKRFAEKWLQLLLTPKYAGCVVELIQYDPSALNGADTEAGELAWPETVSRALSVPAVPHYTNEPTLRQTPVRQRLETMIDGALPALWISPTCKVTLKGMSSKYHYENQNKDPGAPPKEKPEKNPWSHPCEAGEYGTGSYTDRNAIIDRSAQVSRHRFGQAGPNFSRGAAPARRGDFDPMKY